jgi:hypothetical protein
MVLVETCHSFALDQDYPSRPRYWHVDMNPHSASSIYLGPGSSQVYSDLRQGNAGVGPSIRGWVGQPQTSTPSVGYIEGQMLARNGQAPLYGYEHASDGSLSLAASNIRVPRAQTCEALTTDMVPAYPYQQLRPQYKTRTETRTGLQVQVTAQAPSTSSSPTWLETYGSALSTWYSKSPVHSTGIRIMQPASAEPSVRYAQPVIIKPPTWTYQSVPTHVYPPEGSTSASGHHTAMNTAISSYPVPEIEPSPGGMYLAMSAPQAQSIHVPEDGQMTTSGESLGAGPGPVPNRVRRKVTIGRIRLLEPEGISYSFTPAGREGPSSKMAQSQSLSGALTHSGVYALEPPVTADTTNHWAGQDVPQSESPIPVDSFSSELMARSGQRPSSIERHYPVETADLYNIDSVSIPAYVTTSHVPLPVGSQMGPPLAMTPLSLPLVATSMLEAGTAASLCRFTSTTDNDEPDGQLFSDPAYEGHHGGRSYTHIHVSSRSGKFSALQPTSSDLERFSRVPLERTQPPHESKAEDNLENMQDVRSVYPGLVAYRTLPVAVGDSVATSTTVTQQAGASDPRRKRIKQGATTMSTLPAHFEAMDYPGFGSKGNRPRLTIACQGCRDKKAKSVGGSFGSPSRRTC